MRLSLQAKQSTEAISRTAELEQHYQTLEAQLAVISDKERTYIEKVHSLEGELRSVNDHLS